MMYGRATDKVGVRGQVTYPPINVLDRVDTEDGMN